MGNTGRKPNGRSLTPYHNTIEHVISDCPLFEDQRLAIFGSLSPSLLFLFGSERGGRQLVEFLHATQALLRPLPPRPDPLLALKGLGGSRDRKEQDGPTCTLSVCIGSTVLIDKPL